MMVWMGIIIVIFINPYYCNMKIDSISFYINKIFYFTKIIVWNNQNENVFLSWHKVEIANMTEVISLHKFTRFWKSHSRAVVEKDLPNFLQNSFFCKKRVREGERANKKPENGKVSLYNQNFLLGFYSFAIEIRRRRKVKTYDKSINTRGWRRNKF